MDESKLLYAESHEWVSESEGQCTIGITRFAVEQLTDIVYVELPEVGKTLSKGDPFGVIESVKAVSDLYAPVAGEIIETNTAVVDDPSILTEDPYDKGWMIKIKIVEPVDASSLLDKAAYDAKIQGDAGH
ncbi:Glycine cleavage system H protein [Planctomycetes bacterium Pan216]|uniref:Glycine cleavage system H protein n=1 Tax=Kolteria novifilia TaxID=2527975 RepID=A0A518B1N4_9BACT|nr:Glycine cleavage system H protein [Planctomycetes bacterium Pan216]